MFEKPASYDNLRHYVETRWGLAQPQAKLLIDVELGLTLLQEIGLDDEPLCVLWIVLSGIAIPDPRLNTMTPEQRRAIANARILLGNYAGRFAWERDLLDYLHIPLSARQYDFDPENLCSQVIAASMRQDTDPEREQGLRTCLYESLQHSRRSMRYPDAPGKYVFTAPYAQKLTVNLSQEDINCASEPNAWMVHSQRDRRPIRIHWEELEDIARFLDSHEFNPQWVARLANVRHCPVAPDGTVKHELNKELILDGLTHLAGMVGSGKSTLMILIAALGIWREIELGKGWRTLLTVQDTQMVLDLTHRFNRWFGRDAENDQAVATALIGYSGRSQHADRLYHSQDYRDSVERGETHWGERVLNSTCPLQSQILPGDWQNVDYRVIPVGQEPCARLMESAAPAGLKYPRQFMCPLFHTCPSQQRFGDMADALVWITTPGALGQASIPPQLDQRPVRISDIIYEQCDLVVLDEVDTVQEWFDRLYARETILVMEELGGLLQRLDSKVSEFLNWNPSLKDPDTLRWVEAVRQARVIAQKILILLDEEEGYRELAQWIERGHFTALNLFTMLAHRMCGLHDREEPPDSETDEQQKRLLDLFARFQSLDPLNIPEVSEESGFEDSDYILYQLGQIAKNIGDHGISRQYPELEQECEDWLQAVVPDLESYLNVLNARLSESDSARDRGYQVDTLITLAHRLEFVICTTLLDRQTRIVFYQQHRILPELANDESLFYRGIPRNLLNILPVPPTGRSFGIYYSHPSQDRPGQASNLLSTYGYTNIGRSFAMELHSLRQDIEGVSGPHVLAMSGTSFLPGSTLWNYDVIPKGILEPTDEAKNALASSTFAFTPYNYEGKAISVSGVPNKKQQLQRIARDMVEGDRVHGGSLGRELEFLEDLASERPDYWFDRSRLLMLVNSYDQAEGMALELRRQWPAMAERIAFLTRQASSDETDDEWFSESTVARSDIEQIALLDVKILVAPLQSIGRAFNILNTERKAAFGSVFFMTRPMPYPEGVQIIAQEVNSQTMTWIKDRDDPMWQVDGLYERGRALRDRAFELWRSIEQRTTYERLSDSERNDLAMTTAGRLIQAVGRLLRGDVPFRGFFVDAAWARAQTNNGTLDTARTSLLAAVIESLSECVANTEVGEILYGPLLNCLEQTENFDWTIE